MNKHFFGLNPSYKEFSEKHPDVTLLGLCWAMYWRFAVVILAIEFIIAAIMMLCFGLFFSSMGSHRPTTHQHVDDELYDPWRAGDGYIHTSLTLGSKVVEVDCPNIGSEMSLGSENASVYELQAFLKQAGVFTGEVNGKYGTTTKTAVAAFQKQVPIDATTIGDVDQQTVEYFQSGCGTL